MALSKKEQIEKYGNAARIYFYLAEKYNMPHNGICGILGNIQAESSFNPGIEEKTTRADKGYGICQWTFGRRTKLAEFCGKKGKPINDLNTQCDFLMHELENSYKAVYDVVSDGNKSPEECADVFVRKFEIPANVDSTSKVRQKNAKEWASKLEGANGGGLGLEVHVEKLYSSATNWEAYQKEEKKDSTTDLAKRIAEEVRNSLNSFKVDILPDEKYQSIEKSSFSKSSVKNKNKIKADVKGSNLPVCPTIVEAPFVQLNINGTIIGTYNKNNTYDNFPNYIQGCKIIKTNGSINQYTISLIHQIRPGDNPNYIDELLSTVGYDVITIMYGDGNNNEIFRQDRILITDVQESFNFTSCNISYTISATSLSGLSITDKRNFSEVEDKPSNIIRQLLYSEKSNLLEYFEGMRNKSIVDSMGMIPTNDKKVSIEAVANITPFDYLRKLVSLMQNENDDKVSSYYLTIEDGIDTIIGGTYFKITEVGNGSIIANDFIYEVNVGYPDDNLIYNFNISTDYGYALAYNFGSSVSNVNYRIDSVGEMVSKTANRVISNEALFEGDNAIEDNWWTQMTEFPVSATLTCKGLMKSMLLMSYIKVNCYYYGNKRIGSGMYVVIGQEDSLDGNGFRTSLNLLRVGGDNQYIKTDGRVVT